MPTVSVDLDDLESLVFATAAIKTIEQALSTAKRDPFVRPHLDRTDAHNRVAEAVRHARRSLNLGNTVIAWDEPLTDEEADAFTRVLKCEKQERGYTGPPYLVIKGNEKVTKDGLMGIFDHLAAKGGVVIGQLAAGVVWPGAPQAELIPRPEYGVKSTPRGRAKFEEWKARRVVEASHD